MKKKITILCCAILILSGVFVNACRVYANEVSKKTIGKIYELGVKDAYEINKAQYISTGEGRFVLKGDISDISMKDGFVSYAVESGNIKIMLDNNYAKNLLEPVQQEDWHIVADKSKIVDSTEFDESIGFGAIVVQTSKDGKTWINVDKEANVFDISKKDVINNREINGESIGAFYETSNVQITAGCYFRIIVAYKLQRTVDPSQVLFVEVENTEEKEQLEIYEFYAYNPNVDQTEELSTGDAYEFSDVYRVDSQDGFTNPKQIESEDPHIGWVLGRFYISGHTDVREEDGTPVFLKVPGDKAALWFNLEQELDKCNGNVDIKVEYTSAGSDIYFQTPTIKDLGRGTLIIRKTDCLNKKERQIYTNYLEASATVGANTRVDLFEEGDYEVALDYQLHYDKPAVFGTTAKKTLSYRVFFKFKVRNGDVPVFLRDINTGEFINNSGISEDGFYIDVAQSKYLDMSIKREVLSESMDGLVEDVKNKEVAKEGRQYTDEGIYTVSVTNPATGDFVEKRIYVGDEDILKAHMLTGISISEINEKLANGAIIDEQGQIIEPILEKNEIEMSDESTEPTVTVSKDLDMVENEEEYEQENNGVFGLVIVGIMVLIIGTMTAVFLIKKRKNGTQIEEKI